MTKTTHKNERLIKDSHFLIYMGRPITQKMTISKYKNIIDKNFIKGLDKEAYTEEFFLWAEKQKLSLKILFILENNEYKEFNSKKTLSQEDILKCLNDEELKEKTLSQNLYRLIRSVSIKKDTINGKNQYSLAKKGKNTLREEYAEFHSTNQYILESRQEIGSSLSIDTCSKKVIKQIYIFLDNYYKIELRKIISHNKKHIIINFSEIAEFDPDLADLFLDKPEETLSMTKEAIKQFHEQDEDIYEIMPRLINLTTPNHISIGSRRKDKLEKLVQMTGLIKRKTNPEPKVTELIYLCTNPSCNFSEDKITVPQLEQKIHRLKACPKCKSAIEIVGTTEEDTQLLILEDDISLMDDATANIHSIKCVLQKDLTDVQNTKINDIGTRISVIGILKAESKLSKGGAESVDKIYYIKVNNILNDELIDEQRLSKADIEEIKEFAKKENPLEELKNNFLPEIKGYPTIKEALLLQLFGGLKSKNKRAESHILLLGDPGVAKSKMTELQSKYAKKSMYSSGSGSSKAGLTGAVIKDELTGDFVLEAGAMAKASGGIMGIDEMDKMNEDDTGVMHEAMENGKITINKANINATVNCNCSVLACANPKFGRFDMDVSISKQIAFPPSLLSRFDLIFIMRDIPDEKRDNLIAGHILDGYSEENEEQTIDVHFFKKYIQYCKENYNPMPTNEVKQYFKKQYSEKRQNSKITQMTARQLEGWVRFASAIAKANMTNDISIEHAKRAIEIFDFTREQLGESNIEDIEYSGLSQVEDAKIHENILNEIKKNPNRTELEFKELFKDNIESFQRIIKKMKINKEIYFPRKNKAAILGVN